MSADINTNEVITLALIVGHCLASLNHINDLLSNNDAGSTAKASAKAYEAIKFIKDKTSIYNNATIQIPDGVDNARENDSV